MVANFVTVVRCCGDGNRPTSRCRRNAEITRQYSLTVVYARRLLLEVVRLRELMEIAGRGWRECIFYSLSAHIHRACCHALVAQRASTLRFCHPAWGRGTPFLPLLLPCPFTSLSFALYYFFPFSFFSFTFLIFFYCPSDPFLPESSHSVSRREVVGGDRTWV